ncbi:MAG: sulfite exporter TauE/SafE family protein [Clostridia bacterium]|nr:sulfite exporter TauE/SafE family protein [Clostridia bacterium]
MAAIAAALALAGGVLQGVTGFGASVVMMLGLPYFFALPQAAGISTAVCTALNALMVWRYRDSVNVKKALMPSVLYLAVSTVCINFGSRVDGPLLKKIFGGFLILLAIYYLFFDRKTGGRKLPLPVAALCVVVSGACDGLFGIGGPLMVVYYMRTIESRREYLGTISLCFGVNCLYNTVYRLITGVLRAEHLPPIGVGIAAVIAGVWIAGWIADKLNAELLRKLTYVTIGVSGLINLIL